MQQKVCSDGRNRQKKSLFTPFTTTHTQHTRVKIKIKTKKKRRKTRKTPTQNRGQNKKKRRCLFCGRGPKYGQMFWELNWTKVKKKLETRCTPPILDTKHCSFPQSTPVPERQRRRHARPWKSESYIEMKLNSRRPGWRRWLAARVQRQRRWRRRLRLRAEVVRAANRTVVVQQTGSPGVGIGASCYCHCCCWPKGYGVSMCLERARTPHTVL